MVIKLDNLTKWKKCPAGDALLLNGVQPRRVRVQVNTPEPTAFFAMPQTAVEAAEPYFVGVVQGLETIEFQVEGPWVLKPETESGAGDTWFFTVDGDDIALYNDDLVSFTEVIQRRVPTELDFVMQKMSLLAAQREQALMQAFDARISQLGYNPETGEVLEDDDDTEAEQHAGEDGGASETDGGKEGADEQPSKE